MLQLMQQKSMQYAWIKHVLFKGRSFGMQYGKYMNTESIARLIKSICLIMQWSEPKDLCDLVD